MMTEAEWQEQLTELAALLGWRWLHVRRSIGKGRTWQTTTNVVGWPDLLLWNERQQRVIAVELKSATGTTTPEQDEVLASLAAAGIPSYVWRPADLGRAQQILSPVHHPDSTKADPGRVAATTTEGPRR